MPEHSGRDYWRALAGGKAAVRCGDEEFGEWAGKDLFCWVSPALALPVGWTAKHFKASPSVSSQGGSAAASGDRRLPSSAQK